MPFINILNTEEKKEINNKLQEQFGISELPETLLKIGEERILLFTGDTKILGKIQNLRAIEGLGVYFAKEQLGQYRLSIEGTHILKDQITKNIFELSDDDAEKWMHGQQLDISTGKRGFIVLKNGEDLLGCGKASEEKIGNFIPKARRLKNKEN
jgi:NOL1/NOP2/fmu family ribosome biogenesis protein